jgi:hypothetical protein
MKHGLNISVTLPLAMFCLALASAAVKADPQQDQQACMSDAFVVCGQFIPDRERVGSCLVANRSRISAACRAALERFHPQTAAAR